MFNVGKILTYHNINTYVFINLLIYGIIILTVVFTWLSGTYTYVEMSAIQVVSCSTISYE